MAELQDPVAVLDWLEELKGTTLSPGSQRHMLNYLSRFLGWCVKHRHAKVNAVLQISRDDKPKGSVRPHGSTTTLW